MSLFTGMNIVQNVDGRIGPERVGLVRDKPVRPDGRTRPPREPNEPNSRLCRVPDYAGLRVGSPLKRGFPTRHSPEDVRACNSACHGGLGMVSR